ncbi:MAG TPA: CotY/CotZ family spore coat protein [Bacillota bacterium]|nr:CotY/CotZ family spore coat protein [Bacillota bacterium]
MGTFRKGFEAQPACTTEHHCVCSTVQRIYQVQMKTHEQECSIGSNATIRQLRAHKREPRYTTIPFMLYRKNDTDPFTGTGIVKYHNTTQNQHCFECVESPVFKVKHMDKTSGCCATLELLLPVSDDCIFSPPMEGDYKSIQQLFPVERPVTGFMETGICLTVELKHFIAITCLDPMNPLPAD